MLKQQFHRNEHSNYEEQTQRNVRYHKASAGGGMQQSCTVTSCRLAQCIILMLKIDRTGENSVCLNHQPMQYHRTTPHVQRHLTDELTHQARPEGHVSMLKHIFLSN